MDDEKSCEWCEHCLYIGEGDFWCDERHEIIASEFEIHGSEACGHMSECRYYPLCDMACDSCCKSAQCMHFESMPDVAALLSLADEIDAKSNDGTANPDPMKPIASSLDLLGYARRIREACGEVVE